MGGGGWGVVGALLRGGRYIFLIQPCHPALCDAGSLLVDDEGGGRDGDGVGAVGVTVAPTSGGALPMLEHPSPALHASDTPYKETTWIVGAGAGSNVVRQLEDCVAPK